MLQFKLSICICTQVTMTNKWKSCKIRVEWTTLTRLEASFTAASWLCSSSPSSHSVRARMPACTSPHISNSRHRSPTPESRAAGGHVNTPAMSEHRREQTFKIYAHTVLHIKHILYNQAQKEAQGYSCNQGGILQTEMVSKMCVVPTRNVKTNDLLQMTLKHSNVNNL